MANQKKYERGVFAALFGLIVLTVTALVASSAPAAPPTLEALAPETLAPEVEPEIEPEVGPEVDEDGAVAPLSAPDPVTAAPTEVASAPAAAAPTIAVAAPDEVDAAVDAALEPIPAPAASATAPAPAPAEAPESAPESSTPEASTPPAAAAAADVPVVAGEPEATETQAGDEAVIPAGLVETEVHAAVIPDPPAPAASTATEIVLAPPPYDPWLRVRMCESTNTYDINTGNSFYGAYQFTISTWNWVAEIIGRDDLIGVRPDLAAPADQDRMADALAFEVAGGGLHHWPVCGRHYGT